MFRRDIAIKKIIVATGRTDMRKGIDGLVSLVRLNYGMNPLETGTIFLFCGRRKNKIKCLAFEGDGFSLSVKRVTDGSFSWPLNSMTDYSASRKTSIRNKENGSTQQGTH